jgi:heptaprenyl diphosphate synthase
MAEIRTHQIKAERADYLIAWWTALAITIHILEAALPSPVPGIKPGLANVIVVAVLVCYGWRYAAWVGMLRVLVGSLLIGTFLTPTFMLSLSGAIASVVMLGMAWKWSQWFSSWAVGPLGYSVLAALAHMAGQFVAAYLVLIPHPALFKLMPVFMTMALVFGVVSGIIANAMINRVTLRSNVSSA